MLCHLIAPWEYSDVSAKHAASIFRVEVLILKMEALCSFKTLVSTYRTAVFHKPEDHAQNTQCRENFKSLCEIFLFSIHSIINLYFRFHVINKFKNYI
jgi:hypothetical protein